MGNGDIYEGKYWNQSQKKQEGLTGLLQTKLHTEIKCTLYQKMPIKPLYPLSAKRRMKLKKYSRRHVKLPESPRVRIYQGGQNTK